MNEDKMAQQVIDVMEEWFQAIEAGTANDRIPNPDDKSPSMEEANKMIEKIDKFIEQEVTEHDDYWERTGMAFKGKPIDKPSDFKRLVGLSRIAFAQDIKRAKKQAGYDDLPKEQLEYPEYYS